MSSLLPKQLSVLNHAESALDALLRVVIQGRPRQELLRKEHAWDAAFEEMKTYLATCSDIAEAEQYTLSRLELKNRKLLRALTEEMNKSQQEIDLLEYAKQRLNAGRKLLA